MVNNSQDSLWCNGTASNVVETLRADSRRRLHCNCVQCFFVDEPIAQWCLAIESWIRFSGKQAPVISTSQSRHVRTFLERINEGSETVITGVTYNIYVYLYMYQWELVVSRRDVAVCFEGGKYAIIYCWARPTHVIALAVTLMQKLASLRSLTLSSF